MTRAAPLLPLIFISLPSSSIKSPGAARSPSFATRPRTMTRPAVIQVSICLREPKPAAASSFCSRSPVKSACAAGGWCSRFVGGGLGRRGFKLEGPGDFLQRRQLLQREEPEVIEEGLGRRVEGGPARRIPMADDIDPAAALQRLDDLRRDRDAADVFDVAARH